METEVSSTITHAGDNTRTHKHTQQRLRNTRTEPNGHRTKRAVACRIEFTPWTEPPANHQGAPLYLQPYYKSYVRHRQKAPTYTRRTPHFQALCRVDNGVQEEPRPVWLVAMPQAFGRAKANAPHWYHSIATSNFIVIFEKILSKKKLRSMGPLPKIS